MRCPSALGLRKHPLFAALATLELDPADFVIFGSGPLLAHGLRDDISDLDIVVRGSAWRKALRHPGRTLKLGPYNQKPMLSFFNGTIEISPQWITGNWDIDALIDTADVIGGLRYAPLRQVLAYKRILGRAKDLRDIAALELYLFGRNPFLSDGSTATMPCGV